MHILYKGQAMFSVNMKLLSCPQKNTLQFILFFPFPFVLRLGFFHVGFFVLPMPLDL